MTPLGPTRPQGHTGRTSVRWESGPPSFQRSRTADWSQAADAWTNRSWSSRSHCQAKVLRSTSRTSPRRCTWDAPRRSLATRRPSTLSSLRASALNPRGSRDAISDAMKQTRYEREQ